MAKTKESNGTGTAPARKRVSKTAEPTMETKSNVFPINLDEEIRKRAYELYEQRGFVGGYEDDDWLAAEREVLSRYRQQSA